MRREESPVLNYSTSAGQIQLLVVKDHSVLLLPHHELCRQ